MNPMKKSDSWKKWKPMKKHCCIGLSVFLYSMVLVKCYYSKEPVINTIAQIYGPTLVAVIPDQEKQLHRQRTEDLWKKWVFVLRCEKLLTLYTRLLLKTD